MKTTNSPQNARVGRRLAIRSIRPVLTAIAGAVALAFAAPVIADTELETLKEELQKQREILEGQQKEIKRLEQQSAAAPAGKPPMSSAQTRGGKPFLTLYGILDSGVEYLTDVGAEGKSVIRMPPITATLPSRLGFRLNKEFYPGYSAIGTLEAGFNLDDGNSLQGERLFGRQLFAGLKTPYGSFTFGRQWTMLTGGMRASDFLGPSIYALGSIDSYLPNSRYDNSLAWQHKINKFVMGVSYSFGRDTSGPTPASGTCAGEQNNVADTQECRAWSAMVRYDGEKFGLGAAIDQINGGTGATAYFFNGAPPFDFSRSDDTDTRINLGGNVALGKAKIGLGWLWREVDTDAMDVESNTYYLNAKYQVTSKIKIDGGIHRITNDDQDRDATLAAVRGFYNLDKGLDAYIQIGHIDNSDNAAYQLSSGPDVAPAAGESQTGYMTGLRWIF